jgi:hypothetical protein
MHNHTVWTETAKADVRGIDQPIALQILRTLADYTSCGEGDAKRLQGVEPSLSRLRARRQRELVSTP